MQMAASEEAAISTSKKNRNWLYPRPDAFATASNQNKGTASVSINVTFAVSGNISGLVIEPSSRPDAFGILSQIYLSDRGMAVSAAPNGNHGLRCVRGGNRTPADPWRIAYSPAVLDFGSQQRGAQTDMPLTVHNSGSGTLVIGAIVPPATPFSIVADGCSGQSLPATASCQVTLRLASLSAGTFSSLLTIPSNDADSPGIKAPLIGTILMPETALAGTVIDAVSLMPLPAAAVTALDSSNTTRTVLTDADGAYLFADMTTGVFSGAISKQGYVPFNFAGNLSSKQVLTLNAALTPYLAQISGLSTGNVSANSAVITWITDLSASGFVEYGETTAYGSSVNDGALTITHSLTITGLKPMTTYHYRIASTNGYGFTTTTADQTFSTPLFSVKTIGDSGNITVMETAGNYDAKNPDGSVNDTARQEIAKEYLRTHGDGFDFLVFLSTFDYALPEAGAEGFYLGIRNNTQGINQPIFDNSAQFGSASKLQGTVDLGNITQLANNPYGQKLDSTVSTLNHELMHRFGAYVRYKNPDGTLNTSLLGKDSAHWSYLLDSKGSLMYGNGWKDNNDGTFTSTSARSAYSPLDLYLMGMIPKEQVPPMLLIDNPAIDKAQLPSLGATVTGAAKTVTIDDIIAAEGQRVPNAASSQKKFNVGFVLLTRAGDNASAATQTIEILRSAWAGRLAEQTNGIGGISWVAPSVSVIIDSPAEGTTITGPDVTVSGTVINTTGIETGVTVNGIPATVNGNRFIANHVPLQLGANSLAIAATDANGLTTSAPRNVTATTGNYIRISSNIESGNGPLEVNLRISGSFVVTAPVVNVIGPGGAATLTPISETEYTAKFISEGTYTITATATGSDNQNHTDRVTITVIPRYQLETLLKAKWEGMKQKIAAGDIQGAGSYFPVATRDRYQAIFNDPAMEIVARLNEINDIKIYTIMNDMASGGAIRQEDDGSYSYPLDFMRDENGVWRIYGF